MMKPRMLPMSPAEIQSRYERLQEGLLPIWQSIEAGSAAPQAIVVVPSLSLEFDVPGAILQAYEERMLFMLLLLRKPRARVIYVTSQPIHPSVVDYYLELLPGIIASHARPRLVTLSPRDGSAQPLTSKILARPRLIERIRELVTDPSNTHLVPFNTTELERELALRLGIPMYGADPRLFPLGTKSGCRRIFREEGVPCAAGREGLRTVDDVVAAIRALRRESPGMQQVIVKLNEGVSGEGNASLFLEGLPAPGSATEEAALTERVRTGLSFEAASTTFERYVEKLAERGGVVEERIPGEEVRSPSVQLRVTPLGKVELLSTHDQLLGGPGGQTYLGCRFPADAAYAAAITREAAKVGARLAKEGVIGRFAVDFVVVRQPDGGFRPYAIEINLRKGGTTHPYLTLEFLTDGEYRPEQAVFVAPGGQTKCYVATDYLKSSRYGVFTPEDLFDIAIRHRLHFDHARETGIVFHMMSAVAEHGRLGMTAVGNSHEEADALYRKCVEVLDAEADDALRDRGLPIGGGRGPWPGL